MTPHPDEFSAIPGPIADWKPAPRWASFQPVVLTSRQKPFTALPLSALLLAICLSLEGCGPVDRSSQFIPSPKIAESAVKTGMEAWLHGDPDGPVAGTKPVIIVMDKHRKPGQVLTSYQILGEVPGNAQRCFAVRAQLADPEKEERLRYLVFGIDPLWVFRQEDYDLMSHWEHPMPESQKTETPSK